MSLIVYHKKCSDGLMCALIASNNIQGDIIFLDIYPYTLNSAIDKMHNLDVYILDLGMSRGDLEKIAKLKNKITIIDHHESTLVSMEGLWLPPNVEVICDITASASISVWKYFHRDEPPLFLKYIDDGDLYSWRENDSKNINKYIESIPHEFKKQKGRLWRTTLGGKLYNQDIKIPDFSLWEKFMESMDIEKFKKKGEMYYKIHTQYIEYMLPYVHTLNWKKYHIGIVNSPIFTSEISEELYNRKKRGKYIYDFIVVWSQKSKRRNTVSVCLRGRGDVDLSKIASALGGGGHKCSSGFACTIDKFNKVFNI